MEGWRPCTWSTELPGLLRVMRRHRRELSAAARGPCLEARAGSQPSPGGFVTDRLLSTRPCLACPSMGTQAQSRAAVTAWEGGGLSRCLHTGSLRVLHFPCETQRPSVLLKAEPLQGLGAGGPGSSTPFLVCSGCYNNTTGGVLINKKHLLLMVLEAGCPRSRCTPSWVLVRGSLPGS